MEKSKIFSYLPLVGLFFSLITTTVYSTWFISGIEKRLSLEEHNNINTYKAVEDLKKQISTSNDIQDRFSMQSQLQTNLRIERIESKIDRIYSLLISKTDINNGNKFAKKLS